jgi:hypothetical protein
MNPRTMATLTAVGLLVLIPVSAPAETEAVNNMKDAIQAYEGGRYGEAIDLLNMALGEIRRRQVEDMKSAFPAPLPGWTAEETTAEFAGAAMFGGGAGAARKYSKESESVKIDIVTTAAIVQPIAMMMGNPMLLAGDPTSKMVKIKGHRAIQKWDPQAGSAELNIIYKNTLLVSLTGSGLKDIAPVQKYAEGVAFEKLDPFLP